MEYQVTPLDSAWLLIPMLCALTLLCGFGISHMQRGSWIFGRKCHQRNCCYNDTNPGCGFYIIGTENIIILIIMLIIIIIMIRIIISKPVEESPTGLFSGILRLLGCSMLIILIISNRNPDEKLLR